jgi:hypothetical protein
MKTIWRTDDPPKDRPFLAKTRNQEMQELVVVFAYWHSTEHRFSPVKAPGDQETVPTLGVEEWAEIAGD